MSRNGSNGSSCSDGHPGAAVSTGSHARRNGHAAASLVAANPAAVQEGKAAVGQLLRLVGEDPSRDGLQDTPARVVHALQELTRGYAEDPAALLAREFTEGYDEMVVVRGVEFWSLCEHHLLPFHGTATVAYLPDGRVVGLSKLARLVHAFARRLQVQERMTDQIADAIDEHLEARGVAVHVEAEHLCMAMRGVESPATTVTRAFRGALRDGEPRREFLQLVTDAGGSL